MIPEFSGIERRLDELNERLARLEPFREKQRSDFEEDAYLIHFADLVREWLRKKDANNH